MQSALRHSRLAYACKSRCWLWRLRHVEAFVFCANTGRCGSTTLAELLGAVRGAVSLHEPEPQLAYDAYPKPLSPARARRMGRLFATDRERYFRELFQVEKLRSIALLAAHSRYYVETTNMFAKTFAREAAAHFGARLRVVHLWRDPLAVAGSLYGRNRVPETGLGTMVAPMQLDDPANLVQAADVLRAPPLDHPFARCLWYWYEVETRIARLHGELVERGVPWGALRTDELNDGAAVLQVCHALGLEVDETDLDQRLGSRRNTGDELRASRPHIGPPAGPLDPDAQAALHTTLRAALEARYGARFWACADGSGEGHAGA